MKGLNISFTFYDFFGYFLPGLVTIALARLMFVSSYEWKSLKREKRGK